jgi:putative membrane protein
MINYVIRLIISTVAVYYAPQIMNGIHVDSLTTAFWVAVAMSLLNTFVKPILQFLSIPITVLTLGFFYLVVNVAIVYIAAYFVDGFKVSGFVPPLLFSFFLSIANWVASWFQD